MVIGREKNVEGKISFDQRATESSIELIIVSEIDSSSKRRHREDFIAERTNRENRQRRCVFAADFLFSFAAILEEPKRKCGNLREG